MIFNICSRRYLPCKHFPKNFLAKLKSLPSMLSPRFFEKTWAFRAEGWASRGFRLACEATRLAFWGQPPPAKERKAAKGAKAKVVARSRTITGQARWGTSKKRRRKGGKTWSQSPRTVGLGEWGWEMPWWLLKLWDAVMVSTNLRCRDGVYRCGDGV